MEIFGTADNDVIIGTAVDDTINGGAGNDFIVGFAGNDTYLFGKGDGQDTIVGDDDMSPGRLNVLQFKAGVLPDEILIIKMGDDLELSIAGSSDKVKIEHFFAADGSINANNPIQQVKFTDGTSWDIGALRDKAFTGTSGNDVIIGTAVDDTINGGAGNDFIVGFAGNDTYLFGKGDGQDTIVGDDDMSPGRLNVLQFKAGVLPDEILIIKMGDDLELSIAGSSDKVKIEHFFAADGSINANNPIQQVKFTDGTSWDIGALRDKAFTGTSGNDVIIGTAVDDTINGGAGNDFIVGFAGNDTYLFGKGDGQDTIAGDDEMSPGRLNVLQFKAGVLPDEILIIKMGDDLELSIAGSSDKVKIEHFFAADGSINANNPIQQVKFTDGTSWDIGALRDKAFTGTSGNDVILGTAVDDTINGGAGQDYMSGGAGDDTYVVDNTADVVTEQAGQGIDTVKSSISYSLTVNTEKLFLLGTAAVNGTGNAESNTLYGNVAANILTGNDGDDLLDGKKGADTLLGGIGNDTYVVDNAADQVVENAGEGTDTVKSSVNYSLTANVEKLTLTGTADINATGNELANTLKGNVAVNILSGGLGNDSLQGGLGNDSYLFARGDGKDKITENDSTADNQDTLMFSGVNHDQLWFRSVGNNLEVSVIGTGDKISITNWNLGASNHVEQILASDGLALSDAQVANLVNAMAAFAPPAPGQTSLSSDYHAALDSVIAANWQ